MRQPLAAAVLAALAWSAGAQEPTALEALQVTATRIPEALDRVPADISVVADAELRARDAWDLSSSLALVPGVEAPSGGDAGPSSAVPSLWGLHEFDAFLLVVDGVPWGGAFNPMITTLNFNDVQRIEVLKGAAPVMYGATSFVGVVHVLHFPAGEAGDQADLALGSHGSARASATVDLPSSSRVRQSLALDGQRQGFGDPREVLANENLLYRGALDLGAAGTLRLDANLGVVRDVPPSPVLRAGAALTALTPVDANFNPANARIDQNQYQLSIGYTAAASWGTWDTLLSLAHSDIADVRAFLHPDLSGTADTQNQDRHIDDEYLDTHISRTLGDETELTLGADLLYGFGRQITRNGNSAYTVPLDGSAVPPSTDQGTVNEIGSVSDRRGFAGQYAQIDWKPDGRWDVVGGLRLNQTHESKFSTDRFLTPPQLAAQGASKSSIRATETLGASYRGWAQGKNEALWYADVRNAFKPAAIDFGPDYTPQVLQPETALSLELGAKGALLDGRFTYQAEAFRMNFKNLVVATSSGALANAGGERLDGVELEARYAPARDLTVMANLAWHDAHFTEYLYYDNAANANVEVAGHALPLAPRRLASAGLLYLPARGLGGTAIARYVGRRFLDEENAAPVGGYLTWDATLEGRFDRWRLTLEGSNLGNRRPPVTSSEFGSASFYLLAPRSVWLKFSYRWS